MKISARCDKCQRDMQLEAQAAAIRPLCLYCGGALGFDAKAQLQIEQAKADPATARAAAARVQVRKIDCPVCAHTLGVRGQGPGTSFSCSYCSCCFEVPEGDLALPSPPGAVLGPPGGDPAAVQAARSELAIDQLFPAGADTLHPVLAAAVRALFTRRLRGHAPVPEAQQLVLQLRNLSVMQEPAGDGWICPLHPAGAADLLIRVACPLFELENSLAGEELPGGSVVRITTGEERKTKVNVNTKGILARAALNSALTTLSGGMFGARILKSGDVDVGRYAMKHVLKVEISKADYGSKLVFSGELVTGEPLAMESEQQELITKLLAVLREHCARLICLQAAFGDWFDSRHLLSLNRVSLVRWLQALGPGLEALLDLVPEAPAAPPASEG